MTQTKILEYFERDPSLRTLFIFDGLGTEQSLLEEMTWEPGYRLVIFDGAWFNTKYRLSHEWKDNRVILYFNMIQPSDEDSRLKFPLLGEMCSGKLYSDEQYDVYMQEHNIPSTMAPFICNHITELQSAKIATILSPSFENQTFNTDVAIRAIISSYLGSSSLKEWYDIIMNLIILDSSNDDRINNIVYRIIKNTDSFNLLNEKLELLCGQTLDKNHRPHFRNIAISIKYNQIVCNIFVVESDPYKNFRIKDSSKLERIERFMDYTHKSNSYKDFINALTTLSAEIREDQIIKSYGIDAKYWFLPESMCWQIIEENADSPLRSNPAKVIELMDRIIICNDGNENILKVSYFIIQAAKFYTLLEKLQQHLVLNAPEDYINMYVEQGYEIDTSYRLSLEYYYCIEADNITNAIHEAKRLVDKKYAEYTNNLNIQWIKCLNESGRTLNSISSFKHQANFYADFINDTTTKTAVIVCDALRYEIAKELVDELFKKQHESVLESAIAMLPTETIYCKPALLPHDNLTLYGAKMFVDGEVIDTLGNRQKQLQKYKQNALCILFKTIIQNNQEANRELFKHGLVYIFFNDIDEAGHSDNAQQTVNACRSSITALAKVIHSIISTYNVGDVIITSDHGFLLNDITFEDKDKQTLVEDSLAKKSRYYLTSSADNIPLIDKYPINSVSAINCPVYVAIPSGTNRIAAPGGYIFAHGGASLQELIIPIIRCKFRRDNLNNINKVGAKIINCNSVIISSVLCFSVLQAEPVSNDYKNRIIQCALFDKNTIVSREEKLDLSSPDANPNNRIIKIQLTLNKNTSSQILELRIWDPSDPLNPLDTKIITNNTLIERDF